jgi:molybdate-binding protein
VWRLHVEYETARTNESRQQKILDAQKRRLWRRAHGLENLDAEEEQGIDVRGLVPWDDGLTNKERAEGGRKLPEREMEQLLSTFPKEDQEAFRRRRDEDAARMQAAVAAAAGRAEAGVSVAEDQEQQEQQEQVAQPSMPQQQQQQQPQRKKKLYFGIW